MPTYSVVAKEENINTGKNGFYDLYLAPVGNREVALVVYMKILFTMVPNSGDSSVDWGDREAERFVEEWKRQVISKWTAKRYVAYRGYYISIRLKFDIKIGTAFAGSHYQVRVEKMKATQTSATSAVNLDGYANSYDVKLDSKDTRRKRGMGDGKQTAATHEFGHMLGAGDEYTSRASADVKADTNSIMHSGSIVRYRHYKSLIEWACKHIDKVKDRIDYLNDVLEDPPAPMSPGKRLNMVTGDRFPRGA